MSAKAMDKIGRNDPCPCGSGKKYKKCCLEKPDLNEVVRKARQKFNLESIKQKVRENRFGKVRPIIHENFQGHKMVAVGNQIHFSKDWKTMPDFLYEYLKSAFGKEFWLAEVAKPEENRHTALRWARGYSDHQKKYGKQENAEGTMFSIVPNGPMLAYLTLAYDLYVLKDHQALQESILKRLRHQDQFIGARYELYVAATFIRAGFTIEFEAEHDGSTKHPEFIATHKETGQQFAVEAKKRQRTIRPTNEDSAQIKLGVTSLIRKALAKNNGGNFVIFVDLDLPPIEGNPFEKPWSKELLNSPEDAGARDKSGKDRFNLLVFTNYPVEPVDDGRATYSHVMVVPRESTVPVQHKSALEAVMVSVKQFGQIPSHFDE